MYKFEIQIFVQAVDNLLNRFLKIIVQWFKKGSRGKERKREIIFWVDR